MVNLTATVRNPRGKTVAEALPTPAAVRKAQQEIAEFRRFQELSHELVEVGEQVCRLRPVEETPTPEEKKADAIRQEITREVDRLLRVVFQDRRKTGRLDLESVEMAVRSAMHHAGSAALHELPQAGWSWEGLEQTVRACRDTEFAERQRHAKAKLLRECKVESPIPPRWE